MDNRKNREYSPREQAKREKVRRKKAFRRRSLLLLILILALSVTGYGALKLWAQPLKLNDGKDAVEPNKTAADQDDPAFIEASQIAKRKEQFYTFLVCGADYSDGSTRADVIMVAAYDVKNGKVSVVNVPRDTISDCSRKIKKVNSSYSIGIDQMKTEIGALMGFPIDRYAVIDFEGFEKVIDAIGGIEYEVPFDMVYDDSIDLHINIKAGKQVLDGKNALHFVRYRQSTPGTAGGYADGDIGRINARKDFLKATAKQVLSPANIFKLNEIIKTVFENTETDMSLSDMVWLGMKAASINMDTIEMVTLPGEDKMLYEADFGHMQSYYIPNEQAILELVNRSLNPYLSPVSKLALKDVSGYATTPPKKN